MDETTAVMKDAGDGPVEFSYQMMSTDSPVGAPYTHAVIHTADGARELMKIHPVELLLAQKELAQAIFEKRAAFIVIHPLDGNGAEVIYPGTVSGFVKVTDEHAQKIRDDNEAAMAAQKLNLGGQMPRRLSR